METDDAGIGKSEAARTMSSCAAALDKAASLQQAHFLLDTNGVLDRWTATRACLDSAAKSPVTHANLFFEQTMEVDLRDVVSRSLYLFGAFELELSAFFMRNLRPGDVFFDVGAHFGYFSLLARHQVGQGGAVVAFEPLPDTVRRLANNVWIFDNVQVVQKAAWDEPRHLILNDFGPEYSAFTSVTDMRKDPFSKRPPPEPRAISVEALTLDAFAAESGIVPHVIKLDVESAESNVLRGMENLLTVARPVTTVEVGDHADLRAKGVPSSRSYLRFIAEFGYSLFRPEMTGLRPHRLREGDYPYGNIVCIPRERVPEFT